MAKTFANTFIYSAYPNYEKLILDFIMKSERIDTRSDEFDDVIADIKKRQISSALLQVVRSKNIVLCYGHPVSTYFKVITCKDVKSDKKLKTFIDVTDIISCADGIYKAENIDVIISRLVAAMTYTIYYVDEARLISSNTIVSDGANAYASLFCHVLEYIHKISTIPGLKNRAMYLTATFYLRNLLGKEDNERTRAVARKIAGISEREEEIILMMCENDSFNNLKFFVETLEQVLKVGTLTTDMIAEKWMYLYGTGTVFALELFPAFAQLLTDAYVGAYLNNQKTIEKVAGRDMVDITKAILEIGGRSV